MDYDLIVLGGGAGGLGAARAGARRGARVALIQQGPVGGECTFSGCVPSKALIEAAKCGASFEVAISRAHAAIEAIAATETAEVLGGEGVDVLTGGGVFISPRDLDVGGRVLSSRRVVIATGAGPAIPPVEGLGEIAYLTNESLWDLGSPPASLAVLGGGPIGVEMAQAFARLGSRVSVIESLDRLVSREEPEASALLAQVLAEEGIGLRLGQQVTRVEPLGCQSGPAGAGNGPAGAGNGPAGAGNGPAGGPGQGARLHLSGGDVVEADALLVCVGRRPRTTGIGLEAAGVATDGRGFVVTDDRLATTAKGIWAVGDVAGKLAFTHAADEMGRIAASNALSRLSRRKFRPESIPWVTFTSPEVARVGMTEAQAAGAGRGARIAWLPMTELDRAVVANQTTGFVKLVVGPRRLLRNLAGGQVLGATVMAERGGEMIAEVALAMRAKMFPARLALTPHAYPTWSVAIQQSAAQLFIEVNGRRAGAAGLKSAQRTGRRSGG